MSNPKLRNGYWMYHVFKLKIMKVGYTLTLTFLMVRHVFHKKENFLAPHKFSLSRISYSPRSRWRRYKIKGLPTLGYDVLWTPLRLGQSSFKHTLLYPPSSILVPFPQVGQNLYRLCQARTDLAWATTPSEKKKKSTKILILWQIKINI